MKKILQHLHIVILLMTACFCLISCNNETQEKTFNTLEDFNNENIRIGITTGSVFDAIAKKNFPKAKIFYVSTPPESLVALMSHKIDIFLEDEPTARVLENINPGVTIFHQLVTPDNYGYGCTKTSDGRDLCDSISHLLSELKQSGELAKIFDKWTKDRETPFELSPVQAGRKTLRVASPITQEPFVFYRNNKVVGATAEILNRYANEHNKNLVFTDVHYDSLVTALGTKADLIGGGVSITEERKEKVYFTIPEYEGGVAIVLLKQHSSLQDRRPVLQAFKKSFYRTLIREDRWKLILEGIWITCKISIYSVIVGTLLGFLVCFIRMSKKKLAVGCAKFFINCLRGAPILIILMLFYYAIFASVSWDAIYIATLAFGLNFAAYSAEIFRSGIESIDLGQYEASYALGFSKLQTFLKIILPQAAKLFLPVYKGEFISLIKNTSIVGYIAIQDLTKKIDIIRSRTYEAFFPLILAAILYFLIAYILTLILNYLSYKLEAKKLTNAR